MERKDLCCEKCSTYAKELQACSAIFISLFSCKKNWGVHGVLEGMLQGTNMLGIIMIRKSSQSSLLLNPISG